MARQGTLYLVQAPEVEDILAAGEAIEAEEAQREEVAAAMTEVRGVAKTRWWGLGGGVRRWRMVVEVVVVRRGREGDGSDGGGGEKGDEVGKAGGVRRWRERMEEEEKEEEEEGG
ncbi:hypothetical protein CYMTET_51540 [Cymbomonas tetramitiformis]|uniref:Uncharacterized protein n=1 Tax=Cymbomonas tetramitiformis TaxID=36881 RepID=A0AAE0BMJ4_9CHLO|nr:hypothetical protein CYMTET_51540 [Cymbomonas tetramitiformis]